MNSRIQPKIQNFFILLILFSLPVYLIKIRFSWVSSNILEMFIAILFLVWFFEKRKRYPLLVARYLPPAILIFIGLVTSVVVNKNLYSGLGAIKGWFFLPLIFAIIFFDSLKKEEGLLKKSLLALFFSGVAVSAIGIVYKFLGFLTYDGRLKIFWDSPNQTAMFLAVPFLIGLFFILENHKTGKRRLFLLGSALLGMNLYFTFSYGAWLAVAMAAIVIFWFKYKVNLKNKNLAIFLVIIIFLGSASFNKYQKIQKLGGRSSLASRVAIWKSARLMIENSPLLGIGPGNFQQKYLEYQKYFPPYLEWSAPQPHNIFLAFWLESGLTGLAGFIWLLVLFFRDNKKTIRNDRDIGILFLAIMIYILIHGLVDTTYWRNDLAAVFWAAIAMNLYLAGSKVEE